MEIKIFKVHTMAGIMSYQYKANCSEVDFDYWYDMIDWCKTNYGYDDRERWTWGWSDVFFRDRQDLVFFQLRWEGVKVHDCGHDRQS